jgi:excisionase family DNA binding protein
MNTNQRKVQPTIYTETVAEMTGLTVQTICRHIRNGKLKATKAIAHTYTIEPEDVQDFIRRLPQITKAGRPFNKKNAEVKA